MFNVIGGVWKDTDWKDIVWGTEEFYGPFETWEEATTEWRRRTFGPKLDIAGHRLFIVEV